MSDTPRMDEAYKQAVDGRIGITGLMNTASQLERELAAANAELTQLRAWKESAMTVLNSLDMQSVAGLLGAELGQDTCKVIAKRVPEVVKELSEANEQLRKACAELPVSYYPDNTPEKLARNIAGFVKDYTENFSELERHKAALEKCEQSLGRMAPCQFRDQAISEIAKLKGAK